jgi:HEAT repeat protein
MLMHVEQPLLQDQFVFGWSNGKRVILPDYVNYYCDKLIKLLTSQKTRLRWMAADQLGKLQYASSVAPLIIALQSDTHWLVRLHAAKALGHIGDIKALLPLVQASKDPNLSVRRRAITALGNWGEEEIAFETLSLAANDPDKDIRARVAMSLVSVDNQKTYDVLIKLIQDKEHNVSWRAVTALRHKKNTAVILSLINLLDNSDTDIVYRVIKVLGYIGDKQAIKPLEKILKHENQKVNARARFSLNLITSKGSVK